MMLYAVRRFGQFVLMLFIASMVIFAVIQNAPGDPARIHLGMSATPEQVALERAKLGLDQPLPVRYVIWLSNAVHFDLGRSFTTSTAVTTVVGTAFWYTFRLTVLATAIALVVGLILGVIAALNRGKRIDTVISAISAAGLSVPSFALGTIFILILAVHFRLLPPSGAGLPGQSPVQALKYVIMPAVTLAIPESAVLTRFVRVTLAEVMGRPYILTARARGLRWWTVTGTHGLRNAMVPTVTIAGIQVGRLLAGSVVTETVFSYPGMGYLTIRSIRALDYPVVEGCLLLASAVFLILTFVVDLTYGVLDPRTRLRGAQ
ncbi:MAG: ABC transporter permease [Streptosporangiales bacterium]